MELIHKGNLLIENSKSCQTEIATPQVQSISSQTNTSDIPMTEESKDIIATICQCSQTEEEESVESENERP